MKSLTHISQEKMNRKGFTLIELLVVIGVLGILAAGLLAAIDPLEQLKKGRDQQKRSISVELTNAMQRYYAVFGTMPYGNSQTIGGLAGFQSSIDLLTGAGELKSTFMGGLPAGATTGTNGITIVGGANSAGVSVCFDPESKSISRDPTTTFDSLAAFPPNQVVNQGTSDTGFYFCTR